MARKAKSPSYSDTSQETDNLDSDIEQLLSERTASWDALKPIQSTWSDKERLLIARLSDSTSQKSTRSQVTDAHLSTLAFERQARVAAQLPTGSIYSLSSKDEDSATLMNLVLNKYILPNANSQFDALTKLRMSGVYASVYGAQPILYDYRIDDEYIGPDFWLVPARSFYPQPGKNSIRDCDWVMVSTIVSVQYLENLAKRKNSSWNSKNLNELIEQAEKGTTPERDIDSSKKSAVENIRTTGRPYGEKGKGARVELFTKYEKGKSGKWITFAPDFKECGILRSIDNPHKNGRIPIVMRQCFPLLDSIWGLGDFERGITLQKAKDSLINLYLDGVKLSIFPPLMVDYTNVTASSLRMEAGARWLMKDMNAVKPFQIGDGPLANFQGTYSFLSTALLNQFGTQDTSVSKDESGNPAFGKTPQAIEALQDREGARDNWDRFQLEKCLEDLWEGMINLLSENQEKPINFHIFDADVDQIREQFGDDDDNMPKFATDMGRSAKLSLAKNLIGGQQYKYIVDASSTMREDQDNQQKALTGIIAMYMQNPQVMDQMLQKDGYKFNFGKAYQSLIFNTGIQDPDTIISEVSDDDMQMQPPQIDPNQLAQFQDPDVKALAQHLFSNPGNAQAMAMPPQPNQAPPSIGQMPQQPQQPMQPMGMQ